MNQVSSFVDKVYSFFDVIWDFVMTESSSGLNIKPFIAVGIILAILSTVCTVIMDKILDKDDEDDIYTLDDDNYFKDADPIRKKVQFSKNGYICYFDDYIRLLHDNVFVTEALVNVLDVKFDNNHIVITHDGYDETIGGVNVSYITYNFIKNELLEKKIS